MNNIEKENIQTDIGAKYLSEKNEIFSAKIIDIEKFGNNKNDNLFLTKLDNGTSAIFKSEAEQPHDQEIISKPTNSETAHVSYLIGKLLGIDNMISPNIICEINKLPDDKVDKLKLNKNNKLYGTMTQYYPLPSINNINFKDEYELKDEVYISQIRKLILFDMLTANYDRNTNNILIDDKNKNIIAIDHDASFDNSHVKYKEQFENNPKINELYKETHRDIGINIKKVDRNYFNKLKTLKEDKNKLLLNDIFTFYHISDEQQTKFWKRLDTIIDYLS